MNLEQHKELKLTYIYFFSKNFILKIWVKRCSKWAQNGFLKFCRALMFHILYLKLQQNKGLKLPETTAVVF